MARNGFRRTLSGNNSTYICGCCGKRTRETGLGEAGLELCAYCYEEAGFENSFNDGHIDEAEYNIEVFNLRKQYDRCFVCGDPSPLHATSAHSSADRDVAIFKGTTGGEPVIVVEDKVLMADEVDARPRVQESVVESGGQTMVIGIDTLNEAQQAAIIAMVKAMGGEVF